MVQGYLFKVWKSLDFGSPFLLWDIIKAGVEATLSLLLSTVVKTARAAICWFVRGVGRHGVTASCLLNGYTSEKAWVGCWLSVSSVSQPPPPQAAMKPIPQEIMLSNSACFEARTRQCWFSSGPTVTDCRAHPALYTQTVSIMTAQTDWLDIWALVLCTCEKIEGTIHST